MICPKCGAEITDNANRCSNCGIKVNVRCPQCSTINPFGSKCHSKLNKSDEEKNNNENKKNSGNIKINNSIEVVDAFSSSAAVFKTDIMPEENKNTNLNGPDDGGIPFVENIEKEDTSEKIFNIQPEKTVDSSNPSVSDNSSDNDFNDIFFEKFGNIYVKKSQYFWKIWR